MKYFLLLFIWVLGIHYAYPQHLKFDVANTKENKAILYSMSGEKASFVDSIFASSGGLFISQTKDKIIHDGIYRLTFGNKWIDFVSDRQEVELSTESDNIADSLRVIKSESNKLYFSFLKLNKEYKTKSELLQLILFQYPKDDAYYTQTKKRLTDLQSEYLEFVNITAQKNPDSFIAKYIRSSQLPVTDLSIQPEEQLNYLKIHALDFVDFNNSQLIYSDVFTNKTIEYLTYFRNPQLQLPQLEKAFMSAVDSILNRAKVNQLVYQHITEYLIDGFKKFGFDKVLDYIVGNYVIKDDLCLDVKTEGLIKRRIDQAKIFRIGNSVPNISLTDISGRLVNLENIDAAKTLIVFYASWCPHCKEILPKLNNLKKSKIGNELEVLAVSLDAKKEDWTSFAKSKCPDLVNICDLKGWNGKVLKDYYIYATPTMFLVDKGKRIIGKPMTFEDVQKLIR